jgi:hypothetical protein
MPFEIRAQNVLDASTDALILTIDGAKAGLEGNIARQFAKKWPDDWPLMARALRYPIPLGRTVPLPWDGDCPWKLVLFASTLHHVEIMDSAQKQRIIRSAFSEALALCARYNATSVATAVLQGGWRLTQEEALSSMKQSYETSGCTNLQVQVCQL